MTAEADREVLREWRDTHEDVRPARDGQTCVHSMWVGERWAGRCGRPAQWVINYGLRVPSLGRRAHCEPHTVSVISKWSHFEQQEKKDKEVKSA